MFLSWATTASRIVLICVQVGTEAAKPARKPTRIKTLVAWVIVAFLVVVKVGESEKSKSETVDPIPGNFRVVVR